MIFIVEQVKSSPDVRERLVAATAAANSSDPLIHHSITHHISKKDLNTCKLKCKYKHKSCIFIINNRNK